MYFILLERREERSHVVVIVMCGVLNVRVCVCGQRGVIRRVSEYVWAGREEGKGELCMCVVCVLYESVMLCVRVVC